MLNRPMLNRRFGSSFLEALFSLLAVSNKGIKLAVHVAMLKKTLKVILLNTGDT
jgi:hypothetical protein